MHTVRVDPYHAREQPACCTDPQKIVDGRSKDGADADVSFCHEDSYRENDSGTFLSDMQGKEF